MFIDHLTLHFLFWTLVLFDTETWDRCIVSELNNVHVQGYVITSKHVETGSTDSEHDQLDESSEK